MKHEPTPPAEPKWLTAAQVAVELQLSRSTVYNLIEAHHLVGVKIGGSVRVPRAELDAFLKRAIDNARKAAGV